MTAVEPAPAAGTSYVADPRRWRILATVQVLGFMSLLDVSIVNVALPSIRSDLAISTETAQWVVSGYTLAFGLTLVASGRLGDAYGRRRMLLIGLGAFVASSMLVGLAPTPELLIAARLAQGAAAGILSPQSTGLIQQLFRGAERARAFGRFGLTISLSSAVGPLVGGLILGVAGGPEGWRWIFWVNVPIGLIALVAIARTLPAKPREPDADGRVDVPGALLLGLSVLCLLYPLVGVRSGIGWSMLLAPTAVLVGWAFLHWERHTQAAGRPPLLDVALLRRLPGYGIGIAVGATYVTAFTGITLVLSVHLQEGRSLGPLETGLILTPLAVGAAVIAPVASRGLGVLGRRITVLALLVMIAATLATALAVPGRGDTALWWVLVPLLLVAGLGGGAVIPPNFTLTLAEVPPAMGGAAAGVVQTAQRIGSSLGSALLMTAYGLGGPDPGQALRVALLVAVAVLLLALALAVGAARAGRRTPASGG